MKPNYNKLIGRMVEIYGSRSKAAEAFGISRSAMSLKLNGKTQFSQEDMRRACKVFRFPAQDIPTYFFANEVKKH